MGQGEGEEREREWGRLLSSKDLSETLQVNERRCRDPEALRPRQPHTDGQTGTGTDGPTVDRKPEENVLIELEMTWSEVSFLFYCHSA